MSRKYQVISADGHLEIPPDPWMRHVPSAYRDLAPRLVKLPEGGEAWIVEGLPLIHNGQNLAAGRTVKLKGVSYWNADGSAGPGTGDARQRLREQDEDGIDAEVLYPPVFIGKLIEQISDKRAYLAMVRAYNDFLAEYCAIAPDRLIGTAVMPVTGLDDAVAELRRCRDLGLRATSLSMFPSGGGAPKPEDDRFWESALALEMKIAAHVTFGGREKVNPLLVASATANFDLVTAMVSRTMPGPAHPDRADGRLGNFRPPPGSRDLPRRDERRMDAGELLHDGRLVPAPPGVVRREPGHAPERVRRTPLLLRDRTRPGRAPDA